MTIPPSFIESCKFRISPNCKLVGVPEMRRVPVFLVVIYYPPGMVMLLQHGYYDSESSDNQPVQCINSDHLADRDDAIMA